MQVLIKHRMSTVVDISVLRVYIGSTYRVEKCVCTNLDLTTIRLRESIDSMLRPTLIQSYPAYKKKGLNTGPAS